MRLSLCHSAVQISAIFKKDFLTGLRKRATFAAMFMFSLTTVAVLSFSTNGNFLKPEISAALLWTIIFFASGAGISGTFEDEETAGTLQTLKLYAEPQAILFGKMFFTFAALAALCLFLIPIFLILFDCKILNPGLFLLAIFSGIVGISAAGTLTAALTTSATVKGGLFSILLFPVTLPIFLPAIQLTINSLTGTNFDANLIFVPVFYDLILIFAASILFDFLD